MKRRRPRAEDFTLGWICPLPLEYAAAKSVLDELYDEAEYATGRIHNHDIVITCLPAGQMGTNAAAAAATRMLSSFPSLTAAFLVGIAGGVPSDKTDIRLGDVVVGQPEREYGGVVQYDFGKTITGGFQRIGSLNAPSHALLTAVSSFKSNLTTARKNMGNYLVDRPSSADVLFKASYDHPGGDSCSSCHPDMIVDRTQRNEDVGIFFGTVASGNQVIKDGITRDSMSSTLGGVLCFEMEAAGVVNLLPCLVVRGICDYADSHKNKVFQPIAAAAAAACTREILLYLPCASKLNHGELKAPAVEGSHQLSPTQRQIYLESLRFDQLDSRHRTIKLAHLKTCQWLLSCLEYKTWLDPEFFDQHHGFFWIKGKPGAGKSTIMKFAFTQATRKMINATVLSFFFNARGDALEKTVMGMYRSILLQLLEKLPDLQSVFHTLPTVPTHGQALDWDVETLKCLVIMAVEKLQHRQLICFIDALDECDEKQVWDMISFFEQLGELAVSRQARLLICLSSRHYPHVTIENKIELVLEDQDGHHQDISNYVHADLKAGRSKQVQQIKEEVIGRSSGIFLWVVLVVRILNEEYCHGHVHALKRRLKEIPDGLHELLNDILTRDNHNMKKTLLCLQWILYAKRPLTREELYFAILAGIEADPGFLADWTGDKVSEEELSIFVLDSSKGLAQITRSKNPTVQFIHESVRDFLQDKGLTNLPMGSIAPDSSHEALKNCCLSYVSTDLSLCLPQSLPAAKSPEGRDLAKTASQRYPFLEYAVQNLFHHANAASRLGIPQISFLANFPLTSWIVQSNLFEKHTTRRYTASAYLVYIFANNNFANLLEELIHTGCTISDSSERYGHPLSAAVMAGNLEAASVLLRMDVSSHGLLNQQCIKGRTLLSVASENGHAMIVKLLLGFGASVDYLGKDRTTPLCYAARSGHETVVRLLVEHGAELESRNTHGSTALLLAAAGGHETVVRLLLDKGASLEPRDGEGNTSLHLSVVHCQVVTTKFLLDRGADLETKDDSGRTPLSHAAKEGFTETVQLLLDRGANLETKDNSGRTLLSHAVKGYSTETVQLLLDRGANLETKDNSGRTLLSHAAEYSPKIASLLLDRGANLETKDNSGRTPLSHAAEYSPKMASLLLDRDADLETKDNSGRTPLSCC